MSNLVHALGMLAPYARDPKNNLVAIRKWLARAQKALDAYEARIATTTKEG